MSQQQQQLELDWATMVERAGPYPLDAFDFVREGLNYTARRVHEDHEHHTEMDRHVDGQQLCIGLREYAIDCFGLLAPEVLGHWHIHRTDDFGRIVFAMIDAGLMSKTTDDTMEDFRSVYDFAEAFSMNELMRSISPN